MSNLFQSLSYILLCYSLASSAAAQSVATGSAAHSSVTSLARTADSVAEPRNASSVPAMAANDPAIATYVGQSADKVAPPRDEWAWESGGESVDLECGGGGPSSAGLPGVYGSLGVPSSRNTPGSRADTVRWTGVRGNLWLFGGSGFDGGGGCGGLNDLWRFNPSTREWAWMAGNSTVTYQAGAYGTLGKFSPRSLPGGREGGVSWTDKDGDLWMFGGYGLDGEANAGDLTDLWVFRPSTREWAWMAGSKLENKPGVYGIKGRPSKENIPGGRFGAMSWVDSQDNFWLFGGDGYGASASVIGFLNDLWRFTPSTGEWTWMGGSSDVDAVGTYGSLGVANARNSPGARYAAASWTDNQGHLWIFGGQGYASSSPGGVLNDLWEFDPSTRDWTWVGGSKTLGPYFNPIGFGQIGVYGTLRVPASANIPGSRLQASSWTDAKGNFWLFGGVGFDAAGNADPLNDLWEFHPRSRMWSWMGGHKLIQEGAADRGIYGSFRVPSRANLPGPRRLGVSWTDHAGRMWLFGGGGRDGSGVLGLLNDLWEYQPSHGSDDPSERP